MAAACRDVEAATLARDGPPPITRTTFPTCRAHYPGGSSRCACRLLNSVIGWPFETGAALARLVFSGIIDRFEVRQCARHRWRVRDAVRGCGHHRIIDVERYGDDVSVPWFGPRMRC